MQPRLIRLRDAPIGMDRNRFNNEVRPFLITVKIGQQGIAFDRLDLDQWADAYKKYQGKPAQRPIQWQMKELQALAKEKKSSKQTSNAIDKEFQQLLEQLLEKKLLVYYLNDNIILLPR